MSDSQLPLYVDLDGTLIKTDVMLESILLLLKRNLFYAFLLPVWVLRGRAYLKYQLARRVDIPCELLPFNPELLAFLHEQHAIGRPLTLISAANEKLVTAIGEHLALFDTVVGSDASINLRDVKKLERIRQLNQSDAFAYAGNSHVDLLIWAHAQQILLVNCQPALVDKLLDQSHRITQFDNAASHPLKFLEGIRMHQWLKNGLVFLPLFLSHQLNDIGLIIQAGIGFFSFSLCASSVYLMNDMLDLNSDRLHATKKHRPFASGDLPLHYGFAGAPLLLFAAVLAAVLLPAEFLYVLATYWVVTCLYSFALKRMFLVDAITLAILYTLRIIAGSAAIGVVTTNWLLGFSLCLFFGLALLKRYTELNKLQLQGRSEISGRGYTTASLRVIPIAGACSSLLAVGVFTFYINAPDITRLYSMPALLWLICPLLLYLLARIWSLALKGELHEDPIVFAITDHRSQIATLMCALIIWAAI